MNGSFLVVNTNNLLDGKKKVIFRELHEKQILDKRTVQLKMV